MNEYINGFIESQRKVNEIRKTHSAELGFKVNRMPGIILVREHSTADGYYTRVRFLDQEYDINIKPAKK